MTTGFEYEIKEHIGTLGENSGYSKELNIVSWKGKQPVHDLRMWRTDDKGVKHPLKGVTLNEAEVKELRDILERLG